ncbi:MAG TPA: protein kinase [Candidatus Eisenbacteria bacterium]
MTIANGTLLGPYEILSLLGAGGMGEVYRARDTRLGREVAVKVLPQGFASDPDRLRRFEQEARAAGHLDHPNILVIHDVGTHAGSPYLVTELLEGETLRARMGGNALPPRKAIDYALQIARGLAAAHERGLVHRDLKPENLFVLRDGRVKILDFGIAKLTRPEEPGRPASAAEGAGPTATIDTDPGLVMGTAGYMAPEQVRGLPTDHRSDIFAFGAILYEMLSGRRAFRGDTNAETMTSILREEPPEIARGGQPIPPALDRIVRHCLEKSPQERFQSARDIAFALEALSGISDSGPKPALPGSRARSWRRILAPAAAALLLLVAGFLVGRQFAAGPPDTAAQYRKLTFRRGSIQMARFSGDGHSVTYSARWDGNPSAIFSSDLKAPGSLPVVAPPQTYLLAVSRSNELAILLRFAGRPHDMAVGTLARMSPGGAPREILDNVAAADWSPDGSTLAVVRVVENRYRLEYPIGTMLYESPGWISYIRVSPDGRTVAFLDHPSFPDDRGSVMVAGAHGLARGLRADFASGAGVAWSPRGDEVWYSAASLGSSRSIHAVDLKGRVRTVTSLPGSARVQDISPSGEVLVTSDSLSAGIRGRAPGESTERDLSWLDWSIPTAISRDGRTLLFSEQGEGGGPHYAVCIRGMDGSPPILLGEGQNEDLTADGKWALVTRFWLRPPELVLLPTGAGQPRTLPPTGLENVANVDIFPSGKRILVVGNEPGHAVRGYVRDLEGGALRPLTPEGIFVRPNSISPDERWVAGGRESQIYPIEGGSPRAIAGKLSNEVVLGWDAAGSAVYVGATGAPPPLETYRVDLATGKRESWARFQGPEDRAGIQIGLRTIGTDGHTYAYTYSRTLSELFLARGLR